MSTSYSPKDFNRDFRSWVRGVTGAPISALKQHTNRSRSGSYRLTQGGTLMPLPTLQKFIDACAPEHLEASDRAAWLRRATVEWGEKWTAADESRRQPRDFDALAHAGGAAQPEAGERLSARDALSTLERVISDDQVRAIAAQYVYVAAAKTPVGYHEKIPIGVYVDLHTASCDPDLREVLARYLASRIRPRLDARERSDIALATPREGNVLVGSRVAQILGVPFLMVRTKRAPRFGYPIEGTFVSSMEAVIVDDLVMGSLVARTAGLLRRHTGLNVARCFSIFERVDAEPRQFLEEVAIELDSAWKIDDQVLLELRASLPKGEP